MKSQADTGDECIDMAEEQADETGSAPRWMVIELCKAARAARRERVEMMDLLRVFVREYDEMCRGGVAFEQARALLFRADRQP